MRCRPRRHTVQTGGHGRWRHLILPPRGLFIRHGMLDRKSGVLNRSGCRKGRYAPVRSDMPVRQFLFYKHLIHQENPYARVTVKVQLYIDGTYATHQRSSATVSGTSFDEINFSLIGQLDIYRQHNQPGHPAGA